MAIQTAPNTITVAVTGGNTVFSLMEVADNKVIYRAATVAGTTGVPLNQQPELTITRRPPSKANPNVKYNLRMTVASYDALGQVQGRITDSRDFVVGSAYSSGTGSHDFVQLFKASGLAANTTEVLAAIADGAFFR